MTDRKQSGFLDRVMGIDRSPPTRTIDTSGWTTTRTVIPTPDGHIVTGGWEYDENGTPMIHSHGRHRPSRHECEDTVDRLTALNDGTGPEKGSDAYRRLGAYARIVELFDAGELPVDPLALPSFMCRQKN